MTALAAARQGVLHSCSAAVRPVVWGGPTGALATHEAAWVSGIHSMEQLFLPVATDRSRSATSAFGPDWTAGAPWMALHPTHRQHWRDRQQARHTT